VEEVSRTVTVTLTEPQAEALWYAAVYVTEVLLPGEGDGLNARAQQVTENAKAKIRAAIDKGADHDAR
jgi:hypothetical protein